MNSEDINKLTDILAEAECMDDDVEKCIFFRDQISKLIDEFQLFNAE